MKNAGLLSLLTIVFPVLCIAGRVEIKQNSPGNINDQSVLEDVHGNIPDERILWRLFHAKKYQQLNRQIKQLKQQYPEWLPPNDLINAQQVLKSRSILTAKKSDSPRTRPANYYDPCPNLPSRWDRAEAYLKSNQPAKAVAVYEHIMVQCPEINRVQTLEKARSRLEYTDFSRLLESGSSYLSESYRDRLRYGSLKDHYLSKKQLNSEAHELAVNQLAEPVERLKDDQLATVIGWRYFDNKDYKKAQYWFQQAVDWNNANENARSGHMLSLEKAGEYDQALAAYVAIKKPSAQIDAVAARIFKAKAWQNFEGNNLTQAAEYTLRAEKITGRDMEIQELKAWIAKSNHEYGKAAKLFEELYRQSSNRKYARAYVQAQSQADRRILARKAEQTGGELLEEYNQYHGKELYDRKQFQSAYKIAPDLFPNLAHIDSPSVDMGGYGRYKTGEDGLGRLALFKAPIATGSYTVSGNHTFTLGLSRVQLYSGRPTTCVSPIGIVPFNLLEAAKDPKITQHDKQIIQDACANPIPTQQLQNALEIDFSYRKDGWFSPYVKVGSTPISGIIDPTVTFDLGFIEQSGFGNWGLEAYSQPVRQSILSYTGIKDPYGPNGGTEELRVLADLLKVKVSEIPHVYGAPLTAISEGLVWGRVLRTGFKPTIFYRFNDNWNASGAVDLALLEGKNVEQNTAISVSTSLARNFRIPGFNYFNVGPSINYEHFNKNLSNFTYGNGGYFSPDQYYNVGAGINFLTEEGKSFVIKGRLVAGFQGIKEAAAPWFPLGDQAAGSYSSSHRSGEAFDFELKGVWLISPNFQLGAGGAVRKTNGYEDYTGGLFVRYFLDDRKASFSTDIPANMFSSMY